MAQVQRSGAAIAVSHRWVGGGAVVLVHLLFLLAFLLTDKLSLPKSPDGRPMTIYRVPDDPVERRPASAAIGTPSRVTSLPALATPRLDGPMILVRPDRPTPPALPGPLDLSIHRDTTRSLDDLAPPSPEKRLKQFFRESAEENRQAREPSAGEDCEAVLAKDHDIGGSLGGGYHNPMPIEEVCTPRGSAKDLARRNERFSPP